MCVFLYDVQVNSNHGVRLKTEMSFFIRPPLFLCYPNINLNYRVGVKKNTTKKFYRNQDKDSETEKLQHKNQFQMLY